MIIIIIIMNNINSGNAVVIRWPKSEKEIKGKNNSL